MSKKRNALYVFIFFISTIIFSSCKKENSSVIFSAVSSGSESNLYSVRRLNGDTLIACGGKDSYGIMLLSTDKGSSWGILNNSFDQVIYDMYFINPHLGFASGGNADVFKTIDEGKSWEKLYLPFPLTGFPPDYRTPLRKIFFVNDSLGFICGGGRFEAGIIFKTTDQGATWTLTTFNYELRGILFLTEQTGFACGYGIMLKTTDSGNNWNVISSPNEFYTSLEKNETEIWTSGYNGGIYKTGEDNLDWKSACSGNNAFTPRTHFNCFAVSDKGTLIAAGNDGDIAISYDHGTTWNNGNSFNHSTIKNVLLIDDKSGIAVGTDGNIFNFSF